MLETKLLVNELQLANHLSQCVHDHRRSDFSLMLAMLTDDVRESAEFHLPHLEETTPQALTQELRRHFSLPEPQALALNDLAEIDLYNQAELIQENRFTDVYLADALTPLPLSFRDNKAHIQQNIFNNMSVHTQQKLKNADDKLPLARLPFNANDWLKNIKQSLLFNNLETNLDKVYSIA